MKNDHLLLAQRVVFAAVMFPHGAQHLVGWFGGYGFGGTYDWMTGTLGIPGVFAATAIVVEFFAPLFLVIGLGGRLAAAGLAMLLAVAATTHVGSGFFMNWTAVAGRGEGFEYHLLGVALAASVVVHGSGAFSVDRILAGRRALIRAEA
jgi:putative oxidoreductase